jgi:uncharacterized protein (TIGR02646 family)
VRQISKGAEPAKLRQYRLTSDNPSYPGLADIPGAMQELRKSLVQEQRGLCCYCMRRINDGPLVMKVEHWQSQAKHEREQIRYANLLGACLGGQDQLGSEKHCDTSKKDRDLRFSPANPDHQIEKRVRYELDGKIRSDDPEFDAQLDEVLNLNLRVHRNSRKAMLDAVQEWWKREKARLQNRVPKEQIQRKRDEYAGGTGCLRPYCQVAIWLLDQRLSRLNP